MRHRFGLCVPVLLVALGAVCVGCSSSDAPPPTVTQTAAQSAGKIKPGMKRTEVEKIAMGVGSVDSRDPNSFHYPTGDGDVVVTYSGDTVTAVNTVGDR